MNVLVLWLKLHHATLPNCAKKKRKYSHQANKGQQACIIKKKIEAHINILFPEAGEDGIRAAAQCPILTFKNNANLPKPC